MNRCLPCDTMLYAALSLYSQSTHKHIFQPGVVGVAHLPVTGGSGVNPIVLLEISNFFVPGIYSRNFCREVA